MPASNPNNVKESATLREHPRFFFDDTLVVVQIEDVLFKVHKYQLVQSDMFAGIFAAAEQAGSEGNPAEGSSRETPIKLEGASASDFESLLAVLYAGAFPSFSRKFSANQFEPEPSLIIPAFRLANMWNFTELQAYLMPLAERILADADKIAFAQEFGVDNWVTPAYTRLCLRKEPLDNEEARKIGLEGVVLISRIREENYSIPEASARSCCGASTFRFRCTSCSGDHYIDTPSEVTIKDKIDTWITNGRVFANNSL